MYDKKKLLEILTHADFRTVQENGKPYPPSAEIFSIISNRIKEFNINLTPKNIYVIVNENRNGFRDKILKAFDIEVGNTDSSYNVSSSFNETIQKNSINALSKEFDLIISSEQWRTIMPVRKLYGRRYKYVLQRGWTDIISEKAWQQQKFTCTLAFKKHDVHESSSASYYIGIRGTCKECDAVIRGKIIHRPRDNVDVKIHIAALNVIEENHSYKKKRQLRNKRRQIISSALIDKKFDAVTYRRQEAKRLKDFGDVEPSIIPSAAVLRKAKEQTLNERYGFLYTDPVLNLLQSSKQGKYHGCIHNIGLLEFFCIYWSREQELLYRSRNKRNPGYMTIDATGGIIKRNSDCEPPIFLYQCMFVNNDGNIPVFQMVSADHKAMHIAYFLRKIISAGNESPRMIVCDFGWAILIAVAQIFGKCVDLRDYLKKCFNIVNGYNDTLPSCIIRLDVSHFVSMISKWNCLKQRDKLLVRKFYLRALCQAYKMTSFEELRSFFESLLVVALSQYVGSNENGEELQSESYLRNINNIIKCVSAPEASDEKDENLDHNETDCPEEINSDTSDWFRWSTNIYNNAQRIAVNCIEGTAINACYNPDLAAIMKTRLIPYVAIWSGVMQPHFQIEREIATCTSVEAEFAELKNRTFKGQLPIKADKFVHEHLDYIDGRIKLASCTKDINADCEQQDKTVQSYSSASSTDMQTDECLNNCVYSDTINCDVIKEISIKNDSVVSDTSDIIEKEEQRNCNIRENWRGLLRRSPQEQCFAEQKKRRKPSYLDKCPEWDYVKLARDHNIPLMRNGSICKGVNIDGKVITVTQTCAFDAILHLIASGIATIKYYQIKMETSENRTIKLAMSILHNGKITASHYKDRAKILIDLPLFVKLSQDILPLFQN